MIIARNNRQQTVKTANVCFIRGAKPNLRFIIGRGKYFYKPKALK